MTIFHNKIVQILVFFVSLVLCLSAIGTILDLWHRKDILSTRQHDLAVITQENQALERQLSDARGSDYVERIARDKLGMVKDGESIILLTPGLRSSSQSGEVVDSGSNWQKWWQLFY